MGTAAAALLAAALVLPGLGRDPLWRDEVFTAYAATRPMPLLLTIIAKREGNMPLYYVLMHAWAWGGTGAGWLRLPAALAAVAAVPVTALVARRVFGDAVAVLAAVLLAVNGFVVEFARNARTYPLTLLLGAGMTLLLLHAVATRRWRWWVAYALAGLVAIGLQPLTGTLLLLAQAVSLVLLPRDRLPWRAVLAVFGGLFSVSAGAAAWIVAVQGSSTDFIEPTEFGDLVRFVVRLTGGRLLAVVFAGLGLVALVVLLRAGLGRSLAGWQRALVLSWLVVPPLVLLVASELRPLWRDRYLVAAAAPLSVLIALALVRLRPRALQAGLLAGVLALSAVHVRAELVEPPVDDLPAGARALLASSRPTDAVAYAGAATRTPFLWVLEREARGRPLPRDVALAPGGAADEVRDLFAREVDPATLAARLDTCARVWVVRVPAARWHPTPEPMQAVQRTPFWRSEFSEVLQRDFGDLRLELFVQEPPPGTRPRDCGRSS